MVGVRNISDSPFVKLLKKDYRKQIDLNIIWGGFKNVRTKGNKWNYYWGIKWYRK